ncbi:MAG: YicC family protein [Chromatiales bacterium]|jgi:uncharacterized protein (TIGR00255 family)|nr:YicC family protein [Chromatiales bacterium]
MIRSMTGFARVERTTPDGLVAWEIRSVNGRYLEVLFKVPDWCRGLEAELRQQAQAQLGRGRVEASLTVRLAVERHAATQLNLPLARSLAAHAATLASEPGLASGTGLGVGELLRWPGVLEQQEPDLSGLQAAAAEAFGAALAELGTARAREGARIGEMFARRLDEIEARVRTVQARLPDVLVRIRERLRERVAALGAPGTDPARLEQEIVLIAQRIDVAEELDRLMAHVAEFRDNLKAAEPVGRRLDFLVQEFNREANTLGSKSADAETTREAVELKVLIEQLREQVQNVE